MQESICIWNKFTAAHYRLVAKSIKINFTRPPCVQEAILLLINLAGGVGGGAFSAATKME